MTSDSEPPRTIPGREPTQPIDGTATEPPEYGFSGSLPDQTPAFRDIHTGEFTDGVHNAKWYHARRMLMSSFEARRDKGIETLRRHFQGAQTNDEQTYIDRQIEELYAEHRKKIALLDEMTDMIVRGSEENEYDPISELYTLQVFEKLYEFSLKFLREGKKNILIAFDLDNFKFINESIGHLGGDDVLREIGAQIRQSIRPDDFACRIGGDEFVVLINGVPDESDVVDIIGRIADALREVTWVDNNGHTNSITFSAGYETIPSGTRPYLNPVRQVADRNAGNSKIQGRNRLTRVVNDVFETYVLKGTGKKIPVEVGSTELREIFAYDLDKTGPAEELNKSTAETCLAEIETNLKRCLDEIRLYFGTDTKIFTWIQKNTQRALTHVLQLTIQDLADLLLCVRTQPKKDEKSSL